MKRLSIKGISFGMHSQELIGVSVSAASVKLAHLKSSLNKVEVANAAYHSIQGLPEADIPKIIASSLVNFKAKSNAAISIIPNHTVITKNIEIPSTDPHEIKEIINLQAGRHTPYSREEVVVDYLDLGVYKNSYTKILLIIVPASIVKKQCDILDKAGLKLQKILFAAENFAQVFSKTAKVEVESVVHIDEAFTDFIVIAKNKPVFLRSIPIGAQHIAAEREKNEVKFVEEIKKSFESYQSEDIGRSPDTIVVTGASEDMRGIEAMIGNALHVPIKSQRYFQDITFAPQAMASVSAVKGASFLDIIAALFAWQEAKVDLVPAEIKLRKSLEERGRELIKTGVLVLTFFVLLFLMLIAEIYFKRNELQKLTGQYAALTLEAKNLEDSFEKNSLIKNYIVNHGYSLEVVTSLYEIIPAAIEFDDIKFDSHGKFVIKGTAESMSTVFSLAESMEKAKYFSEVKVGQTTKRKAGARDMTDFEITSLLDKELN